MALDPSYFFYSDGTITLTNGSDIATGTFTAWDPAVLPFDFVFPNNGTSGMSVIEEVLAMDQIRLAQPWGGPTLTDVPYFMVRWTKHTDPKVYALRLSDYLTRLKAIPENFEEVGQQVAQDAAAVASALTTITQAASDVEADRQAVDLAADGIEAAQVTTLEARDEAVAARDVAVSAAGSTQALWDTRAAAQSANLPAPVQYLRTAGYSAVGDGGGALYKRIVAPGTAKAWHFQSADGAWWELAEKIPVPQMLGAKGDGATDDSDAIQAAHDFAKVVNYPPTPSGYRITKTINLTQSGATVRGASRFTTFINLASHSFDVFSLGADQIEIRDISCLNFGGYGTGSFWFVRANGHNELLVYNVQLTNLESGIMMTGAKCVSDHVFISGLRPGAGVGYFLTGVAELRRIVNGTIFAGTGGNALAGIYIEQGTATDILNVEIAGCGTPVLIKPAPGGGVNHTVLNQVWCDTSAGSGMELNGTAAPILDVRCTNMWFCSNAIGVSISGTAKNVTIVAAEIHSNSVAGINVATGANIDGFILSNSKIGGNGGAGVGIQPGTGNWSIVNNIIGSGSYAGPNTAAGLIVGGGAANNCIVSGNNLLGNANAITRNATWETAGNLGYKSDNRGNTTVTPNASGVVAIPHGLAGTPTVWRAMAFSSGVNMIIEGAPSDATNIGFILKNGANGAAITTGTYALYWEASL